jgi:arginase family enzyme
VRGFCAANPDKRVGIINIDAHLDVRNFEHGPHNGTPFRAILTGDLPIAGRNVVELGIHGFMNAASYMQWARAQGVTVISGRDVQRRGIDTKVGAIDLVEIDPSRDVKDLTSRTGCSALLSFFAGLYRRLHDDDGYSQ